MYNKFYEFYVTLFDAFTKIIIKNKSIKNKK